MISDLALESQEVALLVISFLITLVVIYIVYRRTSTLHQERAHSGSTPSPLSTPKVFANDPNKDRELGKWTSVPFIYPPFRACPDELSSIKPIPYRPFKWGDYHITMGVRNMPWEEWIELDNHFIDYNRIRAHRIKTRGSNVIQVLSDRPGVVCGGREAVLELVQELAEYLSLRYPSTFRVERHRESNRDRKSYIAKGWAGAPAIKSITVVPLGLTHELNENEADMMRVCALLIQDDLALMIEGEDGRYYFQAGAICVGGFWRMQDKIGLPLDEIHINGNVPQYREKLEISLDRFFKRLPVDKPVIRNNYFFQIVQPNEPSREIADEDTGLDPEELAWSTTSNGPEDAFAHGHNWVSHNPPLVSPSTLRLRTERQTLRRLPKSGAIVFTIRTYISPITELSKERGVPGRMASAIRSWPDDVAIYKGRVRYGDILLQYLDECERLQAENGEIGEGEKVKTQYPF